VQNRAWRGMVALQAGQLLCVLAMSNPHSWQKRPPSDGVWQFGQTVDVALADVPLCEPTP